MPLGSRGSITVHASHAMASRRRCAFVALLVTCGALAASALQPHALAAQDVADGPLELRCDANGTTVTLGDTALVGFPRGSKVTTRRVPWVSLITVGRASNQFGDPLRTGSRTLTHRCGRLSLRFQGGFFNSNVMGELGALEFPAVTLVARGKVILPRTGFYQCTAGPGREEAYGACPERWARAIAFTWNAAQRSGLLIVARAWNDSTFAPHQRVDTVVVR